MNAKTILREDSLSCHYASIYTRCIFAAKCCPRIKSRFVSHLSAAPGSERQTVVRNHQIFLQFCFEYTFQLMLDRACCSKMRFALKITFRFRLSLISKPDQGDLVDRFRCAAATSSQSGESKELITFRILADINFAKKEFVLYTCATGTRVCSETYRSVVRIDAALKKEMQSIPLTRLLNVILVGVWNQRAINIIQLSLITVILHESIGFFFFTLTTLAKALLFCVLVISCEKQEGCHNRYPDRVPVNAYLIWSLNKSPKIRSGCLHIFATHLTLTYS